MNEISIASEIVKSQSEPAAATSIAAQILAEQKRAREIEGKLAEDQNKTVPPELQAKALPLAKDAGLPVDVARRNLDGLQKEQAQAEVDKAKTVAPSYGKMLQDEAHGPIAQSAVSEMPWFERVMRSYGQAFSSGFEDLEASDIGYRRMQGLATPQDLDRLKELKAAQKQRTDFRLDPVTGFFQYPVASAPATATTFARTWDEVLLGAGTGAVAAGGAGLVTGPGAGAAAVGGGITGAGIGLRVGLVKESYEQLAGDAYNEALEALDENGNPLDEDTAYSIATFAGGVGAVAELLPFEKALDTMPFLKGVVGKEGARRLAGLAVQNPAVRASLGRIGRILKVGGAEAFTEVLQEAATLEGIIAAGGVTDGDGQVLADQRLERYGQSAIGGFAGGSTLGAAGEATTAAVNKVSSIRLQRAETKKQALVELGDKIRGSKVNALSPETIVAHAKQIDADGAGPQMSAPAEALVKLFQSEGLTAEQVQAQFPSLAASLDEAATGAAEVPLNAETVVKLAQMEGFASITDDIRTSPDELTVNEAKAREGELEALIANVSAEDQKAAVGASIQAQVAKQLVAAGAEPRAADTQARLFTSMITNLAERTGMDPDALLKRYSVDITGDGATDTAAVPDATTLAQFRETPEFRNWFGDSKVRDESGAPLVVYRGMTQPMEGSAFTLRDGGTFGEGIYLTKDPETASFWANPEGTGKNPTVYPVYVALKNPAPESVASEVEAQATATGQSSIKMLRDMGYDGVITDGGEIVAFDPTQIKSVNNRGTFDPQDPNILYQTANVRRGKETLSSYGLKPGKKYTTREVAAALEARQRKKFGKIAADDFSDEASTKIAKWILDEVMFEVEEAAKNPEKSAVGWYSYKFQRALDALGAAFPEFTGDMGDGSLPGVTALKTKENARAFFTALLAITSDGAKVADNFRFATQSYEHFRKTGAINADVTFGGERNESMRINLQNIQQLLDERGPDDMAAFLLQKDTISNLKKIAKAQGREFSSAYKASMQLPYSALIFGPKLGAFYANLMGDTGYLTMDRWWSRTFNRYRGTLLQSPTEAGLKRFKELVTADQKLNEPPEMMSDDQALALTVDYVKSYKNKGFKNGTEIEKAANTLYKAAFEGLEDQPFNASDREFMINTTLKAQKMLAKKGVNLTVADIQAVLWYYEKRLYGQLGARQTQDINYEDIARKVIEARSNPAGGSIDAVAGGAGDQTSLDVGSAGEGQTEPATDAVEEEFDEGIDGEGTTLNQTAQSRQTFARGSISFTPARDKFKITLTGKADLSTFMHESAHYFLEVIQDLVEKGDAPPQLVEDLAVLKKWMGLSPDTKAGPAQKIERRHHEMFARGFEAYLMEGRAPSNELQGVFNRFRAWLVFIYKKMAALDVQLTDEVRGVMDRLVASDREIADARTSVGLSKPLPKEALYLSDEEYDRYVQAWDKANEEQQREIDGRLMREAAQETKAAWKEERARLIKEETDALAQTRGYRAWKLLSEGLGLDAEAPGRTSLKIDPETVPPEWRRDVAGMTAPAIESGLPLEAVAEILGFASGEEMISVIAGAKMAEREIPRTVVRKMTETHGHMDAVQLAEAAIDAVHSDKAQEVLLTEYRAMAAQAGIGAPPKGLAQWMAAQASQKVMALTRRQLDPARWRRAELAAAQKAAAAKDPAQAAIHKRQQMMAAAMYRATIDASKRVDVIRKKLMPFTKNDRRAKLGKAGDLYLDGIDQILEDIQLKPMSAASVQKLDRLAKLVEEADKNGEPLVLPDKLRAMLGKKNFADMTLEELEGVHDAVMNIWHLAKLKNELKARNEKRELEEALTEMEANAQAALGDPKVTVLFTEGWTDRATSILRNFRAGLTKMEFLFGWLDGKPDGGLMHRLIYQPIADANHEKFKIMRRFHETIIERMRNLPNEQKARWESKRTFMGNPTANGATIISAALNLGNAGNREKLLKGYGWNEQRLMAEINAFMTKADWDFVQHVWDEIDTLWPRIEATTKAATGLAPEKVVPTPVQTPFGTYAGGYYPVVYDPDQTEQQFKNQQESAGLFTNNYARPTLGDGFTKARVDYAAPILLKLDVISRHLAEVVHYVTHYEAVTQADKITKHPRFQAVVKGHMGKEFYRYIRPWLQDVARDQDTPAVTKMEPFAQAARYLRGGVSIGAMGYNVFTGMKQLIGIVQSLDAIGPVYWAQGLAESWLSPNAIANWKEALRESQELRPLITQVDRDIKMINDAYAMQTAMGIPSQVASWAFKHIGWLQLAVNVATWRGAYAQEFAVSKDHQKAVMHADAVVRKTQSAGAVKDLSPIQRGSEINRAVSMFYSWFNVLYNRLEDIAKQTKGIRDVPRAAARVAILVMMSSMVEEAGRRAWEAVVDNYEDDEEEAGYILSVLMKSADTLVGAIPMGRVFASGGAMMGGLPPEMFPAGRVVPDYYRTIGAVRDLVTKGEMPTRSEVKTAVRTVSTLAHAPLSGPYNLLDELFGESLFGEGKKTKP